MTNEEKSRLGNFKRLLDYAASESPQVNFMEYKTADGVEGKTYAQLKRDCDAVSRFAEENFSRAHIALVGPPSYSWAVLFLGFVNAGCVVVPLAPTEKDEMNVKLAEFADCTVFCFDKKHVTLYSDIRAGLGQVRHFISADGEYTGEDVISFETILSEYAGVYDKMPDNEDLAAIMFTSGTTGFPKGVMLTHYNFIQTGTCVHTTYTTQRMMGCLPFHHAFGLTGNITKTLANTRTLCMNNNITELLADFRLYKPNGMLAVPQIVKYVFGAAIKYAAENKDRMTEQEAVREFLGGGMINITCGAAPLFPAENERFNRTGIRVDNGYGMTECAPIVSNNVEEFSRFGSVGKPIPCMKAKTENGEILLKGTNVMKGYYKNPEATKNAFTEDGWLKTGDLGRIDEDGFIFITGRLKNLILLDNGENVSAEFLEERLTEEPLVKECLCFADDGAIYAEVVPDKSYCEANGVLPDKEMPELLKRVNSRLSQFQKISGIIIRDTPFERTASGKLKRGLPHGKIKKETVPPSTKSEKKVAAAVYDILGAKSLSMTDNFFSVGGNSLNAVELAVALGIKPQTVYDNPTLSSLAEALTEKTAGEEKRVEGINDIIRETCHGGQNKPFTAALLTGATGFLGIHILAELIKRGLDVVCLVRDEKLFMKNAAFYFDTLPDMTNVEVVIGDIEKENLGLTDEEYARLCGRCDVVFHTAANVHHAGDYSEIEKTNVTGTKNIIEFCLRSGAVLQHTSTVSVHGAATVIQKTEKAVFDENILDIGQHFCDNVYIHSKYCAEEQVLLARKKGLRANIFRIGNLTWRRSDGVFQINSQDNGFLHRLRAIIKLGIYHENMNKYPMDLTPVDDCADGYVRLALSGETNRIRHMFNHNFLDVRDMFGLIGKKYRYVSTAETIELLTANSADRDIHVYLFYMMISARSSEVAMTNTITAERLKELGFSWKPVDGGYLGFKSADGTPYCYDFPNETMKPVRSGGGSLSPIGKLTLGVLRDTQLKPAKVIEGAGRLAQVYDEAAALGIKKPLFITLSVKIDALDELISRFGGSCATVRHKKSEPTVSDTDRILEEYIRNGCDGVIAVGGGSVLDMAKITSLRAANPDRFVEDICKPDSECEPAVPLIAVPTTAGTGSEASLFAVVTEDEKNKKRPFTSDKFLPDTVVLDPSLTLGLPVRSTAFTGIDALSHAVECYISLYAPSFPNEAALAPEVCKTIFEVLPELCKNPTDISLREKMQKAAYNAGRAFGRIGTGYVHAIAHRLGEYYGVPHGFAIAAAFTVVLNAYLPFAEDKLSELAVYCGFADNKDNEKENASIFIGRIDKLISDIGIDFGELNIGDEDIFEIARKAQEEAKLIGYPRPFTDERVRELVEQITNK